MSGSRTRNVSINMIVGMVCQVINLIMNFVGRTVFIRTLGVEYLGVNGLFTNVLTILSFAELGIGNAIIFSMYKPLAIGEADKLGSLMELYKKAYRVIGIVVAAAGICITPFLGFIIKNTPDIVENLSLLYLLFLFNTVASYFFVYKKSIIIADQKNYIVLALTESVRVIQVVAQSIFLYLTHNFIIYLLIQIICTVLGNVVTAIAADKIYPFLRETAAPLEKEESQKIFRNVGALAVYKFGTVILNGTDNILVSAMVGVTAVGLVSNYIMITAAANSILSKITDAFTASVGNLNAVSQSEKQYDVFKKMFLITAWIYGYASVGLITVFNSFISAWIGRDYQLDMLVVGAIVVEFYVKGVHSVAYTYRTTQGYFLQGRKSALVAVVLNLALSIILCQWIGLAGIFIATPISRIFSIGIVDPVLIYTNSFHLNPIYYYLNYAKFVVLFVIIGELCHRVLSFVTISGWLGVVCQALIVTMIFNGIMLIIFAPTKMFREILGTVQGMMKKTR